MAKTTGTAHHQVGARVCGIFRALAAIVVLAALTLGAPAHAEVASFATYTVNAVADTDDGSCDLLGQGTGNRDCTLREAINAANGHPNATTADADRDRIEFKIPVGPFVIEPTQPLDGPQLPMITDPVVIDGTTECAVLLAADCSKPLIEIRNSSAPGLGFGFRLYRVGHTTIEGLSIVGWGTGISAQEPGPSGTTCGCGQNVFERNYIGLEPNGTMPNRLGDRMRTEHSGWGNVGIIILAVAVCAPPPDPRPPDYCLDGNQIRDNVIAGIGGGPIGGTLLSIESAGAVEGANGNVIQGNRLGTTPDGTKTVDARVGLDLKMFDSSGNLIGGTTNTPAGPCSSDCNLISGFGSGLSVGGMVIGGGSDERIEGNFIGTDITGTKELEPPGERSSAGWGIAIDASDSTVGGDDLNGHQRNLISPPTLCGIATGAVAIPDNVVIEGNYIGTDVTGTKATETGTVRQGICVRYGTRLQIGGTTGADTASCDGACNLISGNPEGAINFNASGAKIEGNYIGTDVTGTKPLGNGVFYGLSGVLVAGGSGNTIGGLDPAAGNLIASNTGTGVVVASGASPGTAILSNRIFANGCLGIRLDVVQSCGPGPIPNDPGDTDTGPNDVQNFPELSSVVSGGGETTVTGTLDSRASPDGIVYRLEFFANEACDPSGYGEGQFFLGAKEVTIKHPSNPSANVSFTAALATPLGLPGLVVTATATNVAEKWTSEFSRCLETTSGGRIVVQKQTFPAGSTQSFAFTASYAPSGFSLSGGQSNDSGALAPGPYSVSEYGVSGWDTTASCDNGDGPTAITLVAGKTVTCTFVNTQRGLARVVKTVNGSPPIVSQSFTFQLRQGASGTAAGTILEQLDANAANQGILAFTTKLVPSTSYALCEAVMPGWMTTLGPPFYVVYNPSGDNSTVCSDFTVDPGQTRTFAIDNRPPPGGLARTIGFWKNWASCSSSGGNQRPVLDQTLAAADPAGITIGTLTLHAGDCLKAVRLLNKSTIDTGKKLASDPAFNLAAQLLAAELNVVAGAGTCPAAVSAINDAQALLAAIHFNGITHDKLSAAQATQATSLATALDRYNNNLLC